MKHAAEMMATMLERQLHELAESLDAMAAKSMVEEIKQLRLLACVEAGR